MLIGSTLQAARGSFCVFSQPTVFAARGGFQRSRSRVLLFFPPWAALGGFCLCFNMTSSILKVKSLARFPEEAEKVLFVVLSKKAALLSGWVGRVVRVAPSLEGTSSPEGALRSSSLLSAALFLLQRSAGIADSEHRLFFYFIDGFSQSSGRSVLVFTPRAAFRCAGSWGGGLHMAGPKQGRSRWQKGFSLRRVLWCEESCLFPVPR